MTKTVVIACIDTRNPPDSFAAFAGLDLDIRRIVGLEHDASEHYRQADAIITELHPVSASVIEAMQRCRIIACASTGYDYVDVAAASRKKIWVSNCPGYCTDEVATHTIAMLLSQARRLPQLRQMVRDGEWDPRPVRPLQHIRNQTLGLIGWGRIGKAVAAKALALGMRVIADDPFVDAAQMVAAGVRPADRQTVLREADYLSLHTPLNPQTRGMIDAAALATMKTTAYLINTARGACVDESALLHAVREGRLAGAALDVLLTEPVAMDHPFLDDERFYLTPHTAWCSEQADNTVWEWAAGYVASALRGERPAGAINQLVS